MIQHEFLFHPGTWIGEGKVSFNSTSEVLHFYTKWTVEKADSFGIKASQTVEIQGSEPSMKNYFIFSEVTPTKFLIHLENDVLGKVSGKGILDASTIAWEFRGEGNLEGFEVYERQDDGGYILHAEYTSKDQFRTIIDGRVWKKTI